MTAKRSYCLNDKPFPVSKAALRILRMIEGNGYAIPVVSASAKIERLRRSGYVHVDDGMATITDAGRALLNGTLRGAEKP